MQTIFGLMEARCRTVRLEREVDIGRIGEVLARRLLGMPALLALALAALIAMSASAGLRAYRRPEPVALAPPAATGFEAQDHFSGAAELYLEDPAPSAAPIPGATGTTALGNLPLPPEARGFIDDASIHAAAPFSLKGIAPLDRSRALQCLTAAVYYEAATESDAGQQAVAQVVLNRVRHPAFPATVCGVVYQGSERAGCQFSFACDGAATRMPNAAYWIRAARISAAALNGSVFAPVGLATHYHTYAVTPAWNRGLVMTAAIGAHFFHRWQGWWGTPAAFRQHYDGHEPIPAPHPSADASVTMATTAPVPLVPSPGSVAAPSRPITLASAIPPSYADSGRPLTGVAVPKPPAKADTPPPGGHDDDSQILDKWKDSGKPLR